MAGARACECVSVCVCVCVRACMHGCMHVGRELHMCVLLACFSQIEDTAEKLKYLVKVINPKAKKESIVIDWHGVTQKILTVTDLKEKLVNTLSTHLPQCTLNEFNVGYFHGRPQIKSWILSQHDLQAMYDIGSKEILLWCDGKSQDNGVRKQVRMKAKVKRRYQLSVSVLNRQVLRRKSLKKVFVSCSQSMLIIMSMVNIDCGQG